MDDVMGLGCVAQSRRLRRVNRLLSRPDANNIPFYLHNFIVASHANLFERKSTESRDETSLVSRFTNVLRCHIRSLKCPIIR